MKISINTDWPDRKNNSTHLIIKEMKREGVFTEEEADIVLNIDSIHNIGLKKGKKLTLYWETDDFIKKGSNTEYYDQSDIVYTVSKWYLPYYPDHAKPLRMACDPDIHKEVKINKIFDYVFVGSIEPLPTYENRIILLDQYLRSDARMAIMYGSKADYARNMSMGKVIMNILPRLGDDFCLNTKCFEIMATGCLMINYHPILDEVATENVHYVGLEKFGNITDEEIYDIKTASRKHMVENHTWNHRVKEIIKDCRERL